MSLKVCWLKDLGACSGGLPRGLVRDHSDHRHQLIDGRGTEGGGPWNGCQYVSFILCASLTIPFSSAAIQTGGPV
jgi:hypothetical protein